MSRVARKRDPCPRALSPLDVTLAQALELIAPAQGSSRSRPKPRARSRSSPSPPVTNKPVQLLAGRFGPYVSDGETNASIPRDVPPENVTLEMALDLLKARAENPTTKRASRRRAAPKEEPRAKKAAVKKAATPRKSARKKAAD